MSYDADWDMWSLAEERDALRAENVRLLEALNEALRQDPIIKEIHYLRGEKARLVDEKARLEESALETLDELRAENARLRVRTLDECIEIAHQEATRQKIDPDSEVATINVCYDIAAAITVLKG